MFFYSKVDKKQLGFWAKLKKDNFCFSSYNKYLVSYENSFAFMEAALTPANTPYQIANISVIGS